MKKTIFITVILGFSYLANQGYCNELNKSQNAWRFGLKQHTESYYNIPGNNIRFMRLREFPTNWKNELEIDKLVKELVQQRGYCHVIREWRWERLPENDPAVIILVWNLKTGESGWCAVKNTSDHWYVASDYHPWTTQKDFTQKQGIWRDKTIMEFKWIINGIPITIWFRNPNNENGWTKHDIWYQFDCSSISLPK